MEASSRYSFGMAQPGRNYVGSTGYSYSFNGKEKVDEWTGVTGGHYDYGFRVYDPRSAKFLSVDPLTASYPWYTPYQFAGNKPIVAIDLDGLEEYIKTNWYNEKGELYKTTIQFVTSRKTGELINQNDNRNVNGKNVIVLNVYNGKASKPEFVDALTAEEQEALKNRKIVTNPLPKYSPLSGVAIPASTVNNFIVTIIPPIPSETQGKQNPSTENPNNGSDEDQPVPVSGIEPGPNEEGTADNALNNAPATTESLGSTLCWQCWNGTQTFHWNDGVNAIISWLDNNPGYNLNLYTGAGNIFLNWSIEDNKHFLGRYAKLMIDLNKSSGGKYGVKNVKFNRDDANKTQVSFKAVSK